MGTLKSNSFRLSFLVGFVLKNWSICEHPHIMCNGIPCDILHHLPGSHGSSPRNFPKSQVSITWPWVASQILPTRSKRPYVFFPKGGEFVFGWEKGTNQNAIPWSERVTSLKKTTCFSFSDMFIGSFQLVIVGNNFRMGINRLFLTSADWLLRLPRNGSVVSQQVKKVPLATGQWHLVAFRVGWCPALTAKLPVFWGCVFCRDG